MGLTQAFVRRPTLAMVFITLVVLAGILSFRTLTQQQFPNIDFPVVMIRVAYAGAPPTEIQDAVVKPIEDAVAGAPDLEYINTTIQQGQASIVATFNLDSDQTTDLVEIQQRLQSVRASLPTDLTSPTTGTFDPSEANVATFTVTSTALSAAALSEKINDQIIPELEQLPGISNVNAGGAVTPALEVDVNPYKLAASGYTLADVVSSISSNNVRAPGGIAYGPNRETSIDVRGDVSDVASVANLPLIATSGTGGATLQGPSGGTAITGLANSSGSSTIGGAASTSAATNASQAAAQTTTTTSSAAASTLSELNGWSVATRALRIGDLARVVDGYEVKRVYSYVGGYPAITLNFQKTTGASEVDASNAVLAYLPTLRREYPQIAFNVQNVQATYTQEQLNEVFKSLAEGILFTGIVMLFFLHSWRNAVVIMIAIPTSLCVTLTLMKLANFTIDTISLLAMTLVIGILVDDSIVVLENTERHFEDGEAPQTAAILARTEMGPAAVIITLVDVVVFLPISFLPGTVGKFLSEFGLVVVGATLTSLFVSFTVTPALSGNWSLLSRWKPPGTIRAFTRNFERTRNYYVDHVLDWALGHRVLVSLASLAAVVGAFSLVPLHLIGFEFIPPIDRGEIFINVFFPVGTPLDKANTAIATMSREAVGPHDIASVTANAGTAPGPGGGTPLGSAGQLHIFLADNPKLSSQEWADRLGARFKKQFPQARIDAIAATGIGGGSGQQIDYLVTSSDDNPDPWVAKVLAALRATLGAVSVNTSQLGSEPQIDVQFDRDRARALDVQIATAANAVRTSFGGAVAGQFTTAFGVKYVQVTFPRSAQTDLAAISAIPIRAQNGNIVHVGDIAYVVNKPMSPVINRTNRQTVVHVMANTAKGYALGTVQRNFMQRVRALHLPSSVTVAPNAGGQQQNLGDTVKGLGAALILAFALVYLLMVALYDSYRLPFIIMFAVPLASVGALGALALFGQSLNLFSMIGCVMLVGLVSKNGILLVDFANVRIRAGIDTLSAIRESAKERFRPIVMTTVSMVSGMLPIALALDPGSGVRQSLGLVVIGGLLSSLFLTLVVVPIAFVTFAPKPKPPGRAAPATFDQSPLVTHGAAT